MCFGGLQEDNPDIFVQWFVFAYQIFLVFLFENRGSSKYLGVHWNKKKKKWEANFGHNGQRDYIGNFENEEDAAKAVNLKCQELNIPLKNSSVGVLDNKTFEKLEAKVSYFYS